MQMQITGGYIYQVAPCGIPLRWDLFWKRRVPKKFLLTGTNNWIAIAVRWFVKYFFALNLSIFWIRLVVKREQGEQHMQMKSAMLFTQKQ